MMSGSHNRHFVPNTCTFKSLEVVTARRYRNLQSRGKRRQSGAAQIAGSTPDSKLLLVPSLPRAWYASGSLVRWGARVTPLVELLVGDMHFRRPIPLRFNEIQVDFGMSLASFTFLHMLISLVGIGSGLVVMYGLLTKKRLDGWTAVLFTTVSTSVTGFGFPFEHLLPSHITRLDCAH